MFMGEAGREMVGKYAQDVTDYYCMASELDNHCVRESACHSIAEMAEKVQVVAATLLLAVIATLFCILKPWNINISARKNSNSSVAANGRLDLKTRSCPPFFFFFSKTSAVYLHPSCENVAVFFLFSCSTGASTLCHRAP